MEVGKAIAEILAEVAVSRRRDGVVELVALLPVADQRLYVAGPRADRAMFDALANTDYDFWRHARARRWSRRASTRC